MKNLTIEKGKTYSFSEILEKIGVNKAKWAGYYDRYISMINQQIIAEKFLSTVDTSSRLAITLRDAVQNYKEKTYSLGEFIELNRGFDIYAPQTFIDNKGRNVLIAWMGIPDATYTNNKTIKNGWQHALSMPRTLKRKGNKILQEPLVEFENLRKNKISSTDNHINFLASTFEMIIDIENSENFLVKMEDVKLSYDNNIFSLEMQESGEGRNKRSVYLEELKKLHIFVDTSSIEIFINDGEEVFTSRFYPNKTKINIEVFNHGSCSYYDLDEFKIDVE